MDTPDHAPSGLTINDALSAAGQLGFERQFVVADDGQVRDADEASSFAAADAEVHVLWRIEGASDTADELMVVAVTAPSGTRGTLMLCYGPGCSEADNAVMDALDIEGAEPGLPPTDGDS